MAQDRPPLGLRPKRISDKERIQEILEAMTRYNNQLEPIPRSWPTELEQLLFPLNPIEDESPKVPQPKSPPAFI